MENMNRAHIASAILLSALGACTTVSENRSLSSSAYIGVVPPLVLRPADDEFASTLAYIKGRLVERDGCVLVQANKDQYTVFVEYPVTIDNSEFFRLVDTRTGSSLALNEAGRFGVGFRPKSTVNAMTSPPASCPDDAVLINEIEKDRS